MGHTLRVVSIEACFEEMELGALPLCPADSELLVASSSVMILTLLLSPAQPLIGIPRNQLVASYSCCLDTLLDISTCPVLHSPLCFMVKNTERKVEPKLLDNPDNTQPAPTAW